VENPSASKCPAADWSDNDRGSVCNDIRVDGEWEHQRLREDAPGCKPVGAGKFLIRNLTTLASRLLMIGYLIQLRDVTRGLIYIHSQGMIHGDLKGVCFLRLESPFHLTEFTSQGKHTDRPDWARSPSGLWSADNNLGPHKPSALKLIHAGWHSPMDGPGAYRSTAVRVRK
jgi:hypothetical protein